MAEEVWSRDPVEEEPPTGKWTTGLPPLELERDTE